MIEFRSIVKGLVDDEYIHLVWHGVTPSRCAVYDRYTLNWFDWLGVRIHVCRSLSIFQNDEVLSETTCVCIWITFIACHYSRFWLQVRCCNRSNASCRYNGENGRCLIISFLLACLLLVSSSHHCTISQLAHRGVLTYQNIFQCSITPASRRISQVIVFLLQLLYGKFHTASSCLIFLAFLL